MFKDVKFGLVKYKAGMYWSKTLHKMMYMDDISHIVWENEDLPVKLDLMTFNELIKYVVEHPGSSKKERNAFVRVLSDRFPISSEVPVDGNWNGTIYADLDFKNSPKIMAFTQDQQRELYEGLDYALQNICPDNYAYIEHSSSGVGVHCLFYFDCEPTLANHDRYAKYVYEVFRYKIDDIIPNFSHIFDTTIVSKVDAVFDNVYKRPYQKLYVTGMDYRMYNCSGSCDGIQVDVVEEVKKSYEANGTFDVKYITKKKKYDTNYYDRLYIITALKKYVGDIDKCRVLWYKLCEDLTLYRDYTVNKFKNMLDANFDGIDASKGHIGILKKYGFDIDESNLHIHLNDDEYISDRVNDIIEYAVPGINLLISGTGTGKTEVWKQWWKKISNPFEIGNHKSILIVEPMNSIINSKYDREDFEIVTGSKRINDGGVARCFVTNYNHLVLMTHEGPVPIERADEFFSKFELVVIDESHIMIKDMFRSDVLIPFMQTLNKITCTKVIMQTATPLFEKTVLNIKRTITIHKEDKRNIKVIWRQVEEDNFNIWQIVCLVDYYVKNNMKVYIYWRDGSLNNMKFIKKIYPEAIIIYHKRDIGSADMDDINDTHMLDTNILISSVYFGVGNDLNNDAEKAAVIVIGNNTWQEDIQAEGRWRNVRNIEMCIVLRPCDRALAEASKDMPFDFNDRLRKVRYHIMQTYEDAYNRDKSVIIGGVSYAIRNREYVDYLAKMQVANEYSSQMCVKNAEFMKLGYDVRETIKPLVSNGEWEEELKEHRDQIKNVRNAFFKSMLDGKYDWNEINRDSSMEKCARIIKRMQDSNLLQYCDMNKFIKSKVLRYGTFLKYYRKMAASSADLAELFSILWAKDHVGVDGGTYKLNGIELDHDEYMILCGYLMWLTYRNKDDARDYVNGMYFYEFERKVEDFYKMEPRLINRLFVKNAYSEDYNKFIEEFLGTKIDRDEDINRGNLIEYIVRIDATDEYLSEVALKLSKYIVDRHVRGKIGGRISKKQNVMKMPLKVTECFRNPENYGLNVNFVFDSYYELAKATGKSLRTVCRWVSKGWCVVVKNCPNKKKKNVVVL